MRLGYDTEQLHSSLQLTLALRHIWYLGGGVGTGGMRCRGSSDHQCGSQTEQARGDNCAAFRWVLLCRGYLPPYS